MKNQTLIGFCAIALALIIAGISLKSGMDNFTFRDRTISARGVDEREVIANIGSANPTISLSDNDVVSLKNRLLQQAAELRRFAIAQGIADSCITTIVPEISQNSRSYDGKAPEYRYSGASGISIYTADVERLHKFAGSLYQLVDNDIITSCYPYYEYTALNDIKPDMISRATHNARIAADQFAKDSGSKIGLIKSANQGYFSVDNIDGRPNYYKNVRVVTSVEFYLKD